MKVLLLSAYAAQSHVYWHNSVKLMFPDWDWHILTLPPRHFSWRVRGNPLYWSLAEREALESDYDFLLATSMVDIATLRGLVPRLTALPTALYFHENQFEYPQNKGRAEEGRSHLLEAQMVSLYASLAVDRLVFNSTYNRNSFLDGCDALLHQLPDKVPPGIVSSLREKSQVIPVPLTPCPELSGEGESNWTGKSVYPERPLRLLWVGRFEYDKGGDRLLLILRLLEQCGLAFELAVVGQQFRNSPAVFAQIEVEFERRLVQFGYIESRQDFQETLVGADMVLSTALHEFQGLAILEAVSAGCLPVAPDRQVYPENLPPDYRYSSYPDDPQREAAAAFELIVELAHQLQQGCVEAPGVSLFTPAALEPQYRELFVSLAQGQD